MTLRELLQSAAWCARLIVGFYVWLLLGAIYGVAVVCRLRKLGDRIGHLSQRLLDWVDVE